MNKVLSILLLLGVAFSFITIVNAVAPNPGHTWSEVGDVLVGLTTQVTGTLPIANGGTGQTTAAAAFDAIVPLTTKGDLITTTNGTNATPLGVGAPGQVLTASTTAATGLAWATSAGGGGTPAGADTNIQFNNAGAFGASNAFVWNNATNDFRLLGVDTGITLTGITNEPPTPAAGDLHIYSKSVGGRMVPKWLGPSGVDTSFQSSFAFNRISMMIPSGTGTTVPQVWGTTVTSVGTLSHPVLAATSFLTSIRRFILTSATTAGSLLSQRQAQLMTWRGNAAGRGGFYFTTRFNLTTLAAGNRAFVGLADSIAAPTNVDPTTSTTPGKIGVAINANTGNWNWVNNVTGTAPTVTALGASFPVNVTDMYELVIYSTPNGTSITYRFNNLSTGAQTANTVVSTNIPANTTFLAPLFWMTNNAAASAVAMGTSGWYLESDN